MKKAENLGEITKTTDREDSLGQKKSYLKIETAF